MSGREDLCPMCEDDMQYIAALRLRYCLDCGHMQPVTPPTAVA